jgi:hypothetical protein
VFHQTLRSLAKKLSGVLRTEPQIIADLDSAVARRNYHVHRYWRERVGLTLTARGRNRMLEELEDLQTMFVTVDQRIGAGLRRLHPAGPGDGPD